MGCYNPGNFRDSQLDLNLANVCFAGGKSKICDKVILTAKNLSIPCLVCQNMKK